jgi:hypothetical protein
MARYSDLPIVSVSTEVAAPAAVLWPLITDIDLPSRFSTEFQGATWVEPFTGPEVGALFDGTNEHPVVGRWTVRCCVSVCEPQRAFGWDPGGPDATLSKWRFTLDPHGDTTTLTFTAQMGLGPSGLTPALEARPDREEQIVENRLEEWRVNMEATVEGIKRLAEA